MSSEGCSLSGQKTLSGVKPEDPNSKTAPIAFAIVSAKAGQIGLEQFYPAWMRVARAGNLAHYPRACSARLGLTYSFD